MVTIQCPPIILHSELQVYLLPVSLTGLKHFFSFSNKYGAIDNKTLEGLDNDKSLLLSSVPSLEPDPQPINVQ